MTPLTDEVEYLGYLLKVSDDGALPALRFMMPHGPDWTVTWMEQQERAALYALGRMRESICNRVKRLPPERRGEAVFLLRVLANCQGEDGGEVAAPRWPAQSLGTVVTMIRDHLTAAKVAA